MSDQPIAKIAVNSLLNTPDQNLDPAILFTAERPGKTRISVINFSGLQADTSRQDFTKQLQMALFTFIRRYSNKTPSLYVLDEAQNLAPSLADGCPVMLCGLTTAIDDCLSFDPFSVQSEWSGRGRGI